MTLYPVAKPPAAILPTAARGPLIGAAVLGALAVFNSLAAKRAERRHPPQGRFIEVDGVRLHYTDRGEGPPVRLLDLLHQVLLGGADAEDAQHLLRVLGADDQLLADLDVVAVVDQQAWLPYVSW